MNVQTPVRADAAVIDLVGMAHATSHLFHLLLPPLFPLLMPDFGFGYTEAGFLMTVFFAISGVGQAFAGIVVDRYGARRVLMAGVSLLAASGLALSVAVNYPMLLLAVALAGMGNSVFHPAAMPRRHSAASMVSSIRDSTLALRWGRWPSACCSMPAVATACYRASRCCRSSRY